MPRCPWSGAECNCASQNHGYPFTENGKIPKRCSDMITIFRAPPRKAKRKRAGEQGDGSRALRNKAVGKPCPYCDRFMRYKTEHGLAPTIDHILPRARGGTLAKSNITIVCARCNWDKGDFIIDEWLQELLTTKDRRAQHVAAFIQARHSKLHAA